MLSVQILCVGKLKDAYWRDACAEYAKRLRPFCSFSVLELPESRLPENPSPPQIAAGLEEEGRKMLAAAGNGVKIALCIEGKPLSSEQLAKKLEAFGVNGASAVSFLIGSSFGLSQAVKQAADLQLSMSSMTFPHQLARVMLCEQIYRSFQILHHGKYHK